MSSKHYYDSELRKEVDEDDRDPYVVIETHKMLPVEPTDGMIEAAEEMIADYNQHGCRAYAGDIWRCMVRAYKDGFGS